MTAITNFPLSDEDIKDLNEEAIKTAGSIAVSAVIAYKKGYKDGNFKKISDENMYVDDEDADKEYNPCSDSDDKFSV